MASAKHLKYCDVFLNTPLPKVMRFCSNLWGFNTFSKTIKITKGEGGRNKIEVTPQHQETK